RKEHSSKQVYLHQPMFVNGTAITNGTNNGTINGTETFIKRDSSSIRKKKTSKLYRKLIKRGDSSDYEDKPKRIFQFFPNLSNDNKSDVSKNDEREILVKQCPYSMFTSYEWKKVVNTNPYIVKESVWANSFASLLSKSCNNISIGLNDNFISNSESDL
ncbi:32060_t:CDS:2, partial [Gigaspora margarita]